MVPNGTAHEKRTCVTLRHAAATKPYACPHEPRVQCGSAPQSSTVRGFVACASSSPQPRASEGRAAAAKGLRLTRSTGRLPKRAPFLHVNLVQNRVLLDYALGIIVVSLNFRPERLLSEHTRWTGAAVAPYDGILTTLEVGGTETGPLEVFCNSKVAREPPTEGPSSSFRQIEGKNARMHSTTSSRCLARLMWR